MTDVGEAEFASCPGGQLLENLVLKLFRSSAQATGRVVVVGRTATAVASLPLFVVRDIDIALVDEGSQRPVHGR